MSRPIRCATCGDMVGTTDAITMGRTVTFRNACPGKGKHPRALITEKRVAPFLFLKTIHYNVGGTKSRYVYEGRWGWLWRFYQKVIWANHPEQWGWVWPGGEASVGIRCEAGNETKFDEHGNEVEYDPTGMITKDEFWANWRMITK